MKKRADAGPGFRDRNRRAASGARLRAALGLALGLVLGLVLLAASCGPSERRDTSQEGASYRRPKNAAGRADSVRVAETARAELRRRGVTDSLVVTSFTRASNGYLLTLARPNDTGAGVGTIWVDEDGSATVTQEYRP
jgi:hypothetical protein